MEEKESPIHLIKPALENKLYYSKVFLMCLVVIESDGLITKLIGFDTVLGRWLFAFTMICFLCLSIFILVKNKKLCEIKSFYYPLLAFFIFFFVNPLIYINVIQATPIAKNPMRLSIISACTKNNSPAVINNSWFSFLFLLPVIKRLTTAIKPNMTSFLRRTIRLISSEKNAKRLYLY